MTAPWQPEPYGTTIYTTVEFCTDHYCRCEDRRGCVIYDGPDREEAERAKELARYDDVRVEERILSEYKY